MNIRHTKADYTVYRPVVLENVERLSLSAWNGDGSGCDIGFEMQGRRYTLELSREEAIELGQELSRFLYQTYHEAKEAKARETKLDPLEAEG